LRPRRGWVKGHLNPDSSLAHWKLIAFQPPTGLNPHATFEKYLALMFT
jgi:hypothetical protein